MTQQDDIYAAKNLALFEMLYGENLISLGGLPAIDNMFKGLEVKGLKALDFGFGLGGVAFYLAQNYHMEVSGIELYDWMVQHAKAHTPASLKNQLHFTAYDGKTLPFEKECFELIYSKGVFNHIKDKAAVFKQLHALLKPKGLLVIADWIYPSSHQISPSSPLSQETEASYRVALEQGGFKNITFRDDSESFALYVTTYIKNLVTIKDKMIEDYGSELTHEIEADHQTLLKQIKQKEKMAVRIVAHK